MIILFGVGTNSGMDYWNGTLDQTMHILSIYILYTDSVYLRIRTYYTHLLLFSACVCVDVYMCAYITFMCECVYLRPGIRDMMGPTLYVCIHMCVAAFENQMIVVLRRNWSTSTYTTKYTCKKLKMFSSYVNSYHIVIVHYIAIYSFIIHGYAIYLTSNIAVRRLEEKKIPFR